MSETSKLITQCVYCKSDDIVLKYKGHYHRFIATYGPFDFYICKVCKCGFANPMPTDKQLADLYGSFNDGIPADYREVLAMSKTSSWHSQIAGDLVKLIEKKGKKNVRWLDVGAGQGEIACSLVDRLPESVGVCIDMHDKPEHLKSLPIEWHDSDINKNFSAVLPTKCDLVYATGVLEHVLDPLAFIKECFDCLSSGGVLYYFCPNYASLTGKILGTSWPYYNPGEHLTIPTPLSIKKCMEILRKDYGIAIKDVIVRPKKVNYSLQYLLFVLNLRPIGKLLPFDFSFKIPSGALEVIVTLE